MQACSLFWNKSTAQVLYVYNINTVNVFGDWRFSIVCPPTQPGDEAILSSPTCLSHHTSYHCRAITAASYLQAFAHRDTTNV